MCGLGLFIELILYRLADRWDGRSACARVVDRGAGCRRAEAPCGCDLEAAFDSAMWAVMARGREVYWITAASIERVLAPGLTDAGGVDL